MKLYFSGGESSTAFRTLVKFAPDNIMMNYYFFKKRKHLIRELRERKIKIFLDSGAFQAWKKEIQIDIKDYMDFVEENKDIIHTYSLYDVIGDPKKTEENYLKMKKEGFNPFPIYQPGMDPDMYQDQYVGLGGLVPLNFKQKVKLIKKYSMKKHLHIFGVNNLELLRLFPQTQSADASSWLNGSKFGEVFTEMGRRDYRSIFPFMTNPYERNSINIRYMLHVAQNLNKPHQITLQF